MQETDSAKTFELTSVVFFGRTLAEYCRMFNLQTEDLKGKRILDCPSGPASFVAESNQMGALTTGTDIVYELPRVDLAQKAHNDISFCLNKLSLNANIFVWDSQSEIEAFKEEKRIACSRFLADIEKSGSDKRYIYARLPKLPFESESFDLVLSGYLLFLYSDLNSGGILPQSPFDYDFHLQSLQELCRVSRSQVRVYPLKSHNKEQHDYLDSLRQDLSNCGIKSKLEPVSYRDIVGAHEMLVLEVK